MAEERFDLFRQVELFFRSFFSERELLRRDGRGSDGVCFGRLDCFCVSRELGMDRAFARWSTFAPIGKAKSSDDVGLIWVIGLYRVGDSLSQGS